MPNFNDPFDDEKLTDRLPPGASATADSVLSLMVVCGGSTTTVALPPRGEVVIGRATQCDIRLPDDAVSRRHAIIHIDDRMTVEDLGSANGVRLRDHRLTPNEPAEVAPGDVIDLGSAMLVIQRRMGPAKQAAVPRAIAPAQPSTSVIVVDPAMTRLYELVRAIAAGTISVLLLGETGVGKEVVAEAVHRASPRAQGPFVQINCAALAPSLLESELFGHERGAFTGATQAKTGLLESADEGTVFLDEVGELPLETQVKLLRVLEERRVTRVGALRARQINVRFVAATNRDLRTLVQGGAFREDLYFRLNGVSVSIPPLRERPSEIAQLAAHFASLATSTLQKGAVAPKIAAEAAEALKQYPWPGNIRELRNVIERAVLISRGETITPQHLPPEVIAGKRLETARASNPDPSGPTALRTQVHEDERRHILAALERCGGNQTRAAELLGISRRTLVARLQAYDLTRPRKPRA